MAFEILIRAPVRSPAGVNQDCLASQLNAFKGGFINSSLALALCSYNFAIQIRERRQFKLGQILASLISMKRTVEIGAGVGDHLDFADLELCPWRVMLTRLFAGKKVADDRCGQAFVCDQTVLDWVA